MMDNESVCPCLQHTRATIYSQGMNRRHDVCDVLGWGSFQTPSERGSPRGRPIAVASGSPKEGWGDGRLTTSSALPPKRLSHRTPNLHRRRCPYSPQSSHCYASTNHSVLSLIEPTDEFEVEDNVRH